MYKKILDIQIVSTDIDTYRCDIACLRKDCLRIDIFDINNNNSTMRSIVFEETF